MDVQAASATATATVLPNTPYGTTQPAANNAPAASPAAPVTPTVAPVPSSGTGSSSDSNASSSAAPGSAIGPHPGLATLPAGPPDGSKKGTGDSPLTSAVAQLFSVQENNVSVSFQISQDPNEIVTVFTDKTTGKVIVQFPSETMIALAKFFNKIDDAAVVNKKV